MWLALGGAALQLVSVTLNFYTLGREPKSAWYGVPHAADLIVASAVVAIVAVALTAAARRPFSGRTLGLVAGGVGMLATLQVAYRMVVPPFGCLVYGCGLTAGSDAQVLAPMWLALAASLAVTGGAFAHALGPTARKTPPAPRVAQRQSGMTPWLGLSALGAVGMFVFPFTVFTLYTVQGFFGARATQAWGGWLSIPHTSSLVLAATAGIVALVVAAARERSPLGPVALGSTIAVIALLAAARIIYRIVVPPFATAGGGENVEVGAVTIELAGYLGLLSALLALGAALVHAAQHRAPRKAPTGSEPSRRLA